MVGFWSPGSMGGVALAGWHLHFITKAGTGGGHVLEFTSDQSELKLSEILEVNWHLSGLPDYRQADLSKKP